MPTVKKLPKWAIKQAGGINKKAWALARRGKGRRMSKAKPSKRPRRAPRSVGGTSHGSHNSKPGWGRYFRMGRTADVFSGPAQGSLANHGLTRQAGESALFRYSAGMSQGKFEPETAKNTYGGIGTGLLRDWFRSKLGIYRGLGQKKILSGVMAANPEILAYGEASPSEDIALWNLFRMEYDRAYNPQSGGWATSPSTDSGSRFWRSIGVDVSLKVGQKIAEAYINPMLPPGYNL